MCCFAAIVYGANDVLSRAVLCGIAASSLGQDDCGDRVSAKPGFIGICEERFDDAFRSSLKFAALLAAGACFGAEAQAQTTPVTFSLDFRALGRHAAWYVALEKGYYKSAGLDVTIIPSQGTAQAIQSVESKAAQFAFSDVAGLVAARANSAVTAKMVAVIYQKAPYAIFSLRSGANVTKPEQLENLEIASGAGSFTQKVIEAFMKSKGLKADTVKYTNIDPAARIGMLVAKKIPAIETFAMSMPGVVKAAGGAGGADFPARQRRAVALLQRHSGARGLSQGRARQGEGLRQGVAAGLEGHHRQSEGSRRHRRQAHQGPRPRRGVPGDRHRQRAGRDAGGAAPRGSAPSTPSRWRRASI